jgi:hypothetical protein
MTKRNEIQSDQLLGADASTSAASVGVGEQNYLHQLSLPLTQSITCVVCGKPFEISRRRGRPEQFCGDPCRRGQHRQQKSDWSKAAARRAANEASD